MSAPIKTLQFAPFSSNVDASFWHKLAQLKLDVDKLDEPVRHIWGYHSNILPRGLTGMLTVDCSSFNESPDVGAIVSVGKIVNKNTLESFKELDAASLLAEEGKELLELIKEDALKKPQLLSRFLVLCFADLKQHKFTYWFTFPAITALTPTLHAPATPAKDVFSQKDLNNILRICNRDKNFFVLELSHNSINMLDVKTGFEKINSGLEKFYIGFADSCNNSAHPGWPLRNLLALFAYHCPNFTHVPVSVLCLRFSVINGIWDLGNSICLDIVVGDVNWNKSPCCIGWERNDKGNPGPRLANLNSSMNPISLAESSVDLNLKLMKWQVVPDIDLDKIKYTKCLLLGAGTLGCAVARSAIGWGVRHITIVDNANVSYSNPVRQTLYKFADVGKPKAHAAAAALKEIFPSLVTEGVVLAIPMPGHPVGASLLAEVKAAILKLDDLIKAHDVIFLLMDSRESRWLPTVVGASHGKFVINAALGFDSYLVIRHGIKLEKSSDPQLTSFPRLGCYFCSDVTAPGNSGQARTLDQQCTVTRPGVSSMCGSLAVELMVSMLQTDLTKDNPSGSEDDCVLGKIPHSIRGFLSRFETILPSVQAFGSCVGCSDRVTEEYAKRGVDFVLDALESKKYLEQLTGLSQLHSSSIIDDIMALSDSDNEENNE